MVTRILPESEWPRLRDTACKVDQSRAERAESGCVISVERNQQIIATAFVFNEKDDPDRTHADGVWIDDRYRTFQVRRQLLRGMKFAIDQLGHRPLVITNAPWMRPRKAGSHGIEL